MKAKEIRIGNLVNLYGTTTTIQGVDFVNNYNGSDRKFDRFKPIPLTEGWLLRFGFKHTADSIVALNIFAEVYIYFNFEKKCGGLATKEYKIGENDFNEEVVVVDDKIKHVHQLQNLYFVLTGTELTL